MEWYKSAFADDNYVGFKATNFFNQNGNEDKKITIKSFTNLTNAVGDIVYTTLRDVELTKDIDSIIYTPIIQGSYRDYEINGETWISVNNLSADRKLFFTESQIAENGIFVVNNGSEQDFYANRWEKVDNLMSYPLGNKVYEFGLTEDGTCYIQFPEDISTLAQDGFRIRYIISNGLDGNIKANTLTDFLTDIVDGDTVLNEYIQIYQAYPIINGANPESLKDAYNNYRKTIGTFNTLITRKDFENFIIRLNEVANCIVSDRTCDINNSIYIQKWTPDYLIKDLLNKNLIEDNDGETLSQYNNFFTLYLYLTKYIENINKTTYDSSYAPDTNSVTVDTITSELDEIKAAQYEIDVHSDGDKIFNFNNIYSMEGTIYPKYKVSKVEKKDIENNILNTLLSNFNPKTLNYGEQLSYSDIVNVLKNSDTRINDIVLTSFNYKTFKRLFNNTLVDLSLNDNIDDLNELVAKMVLSGNVQLYEFDDKFNFEFGQSNIAFINDIESITTQLDITLNSTSQTLGNNEIVELITDNYITISEYGSNVYIKSNENIPSHTLYKLTDNIDVIYFNQTANKEETKTYGIGTLVETNVDIPAVITSNDKGHQLNISDYFKIKNINSTTLNNVKYICILNTSEESLVLDKSYYILQENEYFIYLNKENTGFIILGMGTKLSSNTLINIRNKREDISISDITDENKDIIEWDTMPNDLIVTEMLITSLGKGTSVSTTSELELNNSLKPLNDVVLIYDIDGINTEIKDNDIQKYFIRSRLNLNSTILNPQKLEDGQSIVIKTRTGSSSSINNKYIQFNHNVIMAGGENIDASILNIENDTLTKEYTLDMFSYNFEETIARENGIITLKEDTTLKFTVDSGYIYLLPIKVNLAEGSTLKVYNASIYNPYVDSLDINSSDIDFDKTTSVILKLSTDPKFEFSEIADNNSVQIGKICKVKTIYNIESQKYDDIVYNSNEIDYKDIYQDYKIKDQASKILTKMKDFDKINEFN